MEEILTVEEETFLTIDEEIDEMILKATAKASALAAIPVPLIDMVGVTWIQIDLVNDLAKKFGVKETSQSKLLLSSILTTITGKMLSEWIIKKKKKTWLTNIVSESLVRATIAGFITTISGEVYAQHFKYGGSIENITLTHYLDYFITQLDSDRLSLTNVLKPVYQQFINNL